MRSAVSMLLAALLVSFAAPSADAQAPPGFGTSPFWTGPPSFADDVALGDVDGDGDLDIVASDRNAVTLYRNDGSTFPAIWDRRSQVGDRGAVALGDVDGDGDLDLVRNGFLYLNGGGAFADTAAWTATRPGELTYGVALGDIDGDGDLDLVRGNRAPDTLPGQSPSTLYLNLGGTFADSPAWISFPEPISSVALGDVDGDGDLDAVFGNSEGGGAYLYLNMGGVLAAAPVRVGEPEPALSVALGDMDLDGDLDLFTGNSLHVNTGGVFEARSAWKAPASPFDVSPGDVDGDGDLDIVLGNYDRGITLHLNAAGILSPTPDWSGPVEATSSVALGDLDGDGDLDLVRGNSGPGLSIYLNPGGSYPDTPVWAGLAGTVTLLRLGDVNGDGLPDLVGRTQEPALHLLLNSGGIFDSVPAWTEPAERINGVDLGDINGDGSPDLVRGGDDAALYLNTGGTFAATPAWTAPAEGTSAVAMVDVNGDGRPDLVRGNNAGVAASGSTLYLNAGNTFAASPVWQSEPANTTRLAFGDVDGDGDIDMVRGSLTFTSGPPSAILTLNIGGTFAATPAWMGPSGLPANVALGDIDGDGRPDLIVGCSITRGATLYPNSGGTFAATPAWTGPASRGGLALGDVDNDGDLDFIGGSLLHLNAGGSFEFTPDWSAPAAGYQTVVLGDVNNDGGLDAVFGKSALDTNPGAELYLRKSPWLSPDGGPSASLPNNAGHIRNVRVAPVDSNAYRVTFDAFDMESDPLWIVGEYQLAGASWHPMSMNGSLLRTGPFTTSSEGTAGQFTWDTTLLPFDYRDVNIRLRADSPSRRVAMAQFMPSYLKTVGRVVPRRPDLAVMPAALDFSTLTVGDSAEMALRLRNQGNLDLSISAIETSDDDVILHTTGPLTLPGGQEVTVPVTLAPIARHGAGPLRLHSNDPGKPILEIPVDADIRALEFESRLLTTRAKLPLAEAVTIVVTPAPQVRIERGWVFIRSADAEAPTDSLPLEPLGSAFAIVVPGAHVTEAGFDYYVRVENSGIVAFAPAGAPQSAFHYDVSPPQGIASEAVSGPRGGLPVDVPIPIRVTLAPGTRFESGTLYYRAGGAARYDSTAIDGAPGDLTASGVIPAEGVTAGGVEYWIRVRTLSTGGSPLTDPPFDPAAHPYVLRTSVTDLIEPGGLRGGERYRMVSIPLDLDVPGTGSLESILSDQPAFGPYDPRRWRSFRYLNGNYVEISETGGPSGNLRPEAGRGFWLIARLPNRIETAPVTGRSTPTDAPFLIPLAPGWNQIGHPFAFAVSRENVILPAGVSDLTAFDPDRGEYVDGFVTALRPFEGYFIFNGSSEPETLRVCPVAVPPAGQADVMPESGLPVVGPDGWRLRLRAISAASAAVSTVVGVSAGALDGRDPLDSRDPPPLPGLAMRLGVRHHDWGTDSGLYRIDLRDPEAGGHTWDLELRTDNAGDRIDLEFPAGDDLPEDLAIALVDLEQGTSIRLREPGEPLRRSTSLISYRRDTPYRLRLLAGTEFYVTAGLSGINSPPASVVLDNSAPNPSHGATRIRYGLPGYRRVTLEIFNVRGALVSRLIDGALFPGGYHSVIWDGSDNRGSRAPNGIYFYRLSIESGEVRTRRLTLAR